MVIFRKQDTRVSLWNKRKSRIFTSLFYLVEGREGRHSHHTDVNFTLMLRNNSQY